MIAPVATSLPVFPVVRWVTVPSRAEPSAGGDRGYACGRFAGLAEGVTKVTLHRPVPFDRPLSAVLAAGGINVRDRGELIAQVRAGASLEGLEPPLRPSIEEAIRYSEVGGDPDLHAAPLLPEGLRPLAGGALGAEVVWAALEHAGSAPQPLGTPARVLARMTVEQLAPVPADGPSVVVSWQLPSAGRGLHTAAALLSAGGELLARSRALWTEGGSSAADVARTAGGRRPASLPHLIPS